MEAGKRLGHYEIIEPLGAGGMGEVYRARDTNLQREVAIKVLPEDLAADQERLARLQREAHLLAALNHANIASIHSLERDADTRFLVLELVEGETLAARLKRGALPVQEALEAAKQIAEALEAAHEKGIIHRDLKPANVMLTPGDNIKVLDFGLAKAFEVDGEAGDLTQSPTITVAGTKTGVIQGTAAYMSPEQARGKVLDKRTDIFSFGCVLYEMLTGRRPFVGEDVAETMAAILKQEPDWSALPPGTPPLAQSLLRRCLRKDPDRRLHDVSDVRIEIEEALAALSEGHPNDLALALTLERSWRHRFPWVLLGLATAVILILLVGLWQATRPLEQARMRFRISLPTDKSLYTTSQALALSPGGERLAYVADVGRSLQQYDPLGGGTQIYVRHLEELGVKPLSGTEGASNVFFSPDGQWLGFAAGGELRKISVSGGPVLTLCDVQGMVSASWGPDGTIIFNRSATGGLWRVQAAGGTPEQITVPESEEGEDSHRYPHVLADGRAVLFSAGRVGRFDEAKIVVQSLETGERKVLQLRGYDVRYVSTGHLVFVHQESLFAVPFDVNRLVVVGSPALVQEGVWTDPPSGAANFAFSRTGTLVYQPAGEDRPQRSLVWVDREGRAEPLVAEPGDYMHPRISPDGSQLSVSVNDSGNWDVWIYDLTRQTSSRLTFDPALDNRQIWTPDGRRVVFRSGRARPGSSLFSKAADGTGEVERLTTSPHSQVPHSWSLDGKTLVFEQFNPETAQDLYVLSMEGERNSKPLIQTEFTEDRPAISPDGRWIVYRTNESGRFEIYVRPFPNVEEGKWKISTEGGISPAWGPRGRELFYRSLDDGAMMVVIVETEPTFAAATPEVLFTERYYRSSGRNYDVSLDGQRFLMLKEVGPTEGTTQFVVVTNWFEELKQRVPTGR